jgi:hypothetical protein
MPANLLNSALAYLHHLVNEGDPAAVGVLAIMNGTRWVDISAAAESSNTRVITCTVKNQAGERVKATAQVVVESFADAGTSLTAVRVATTAALASCTASGTGIGKTLTATANGALSIDSVAVSAADRVLIKNQVAGADNGIYTVTQTGSGGTPFILTRAIDFDTAAEALNGLQIPVTAGTTNTGKTFVHTTTPPITIDTTALVFTDKSTLTVADLNGITAGGTGTLKAGSATSQAWFTTDSNGVFALTLKNVLIGNVLLKFTTDNGEAEEVVVAFA